ncbi:MAG: 30S ribosomal protein S9 [Gemmataceae bacterium]
MQPRKQRPAVFLGKKRAYQATGRRKTAVARVFLTEGEGSISINGKDLMVYFTEERDRSAVLGPLQVCDLMNRVDVIVNVHGGGTTGQAGAVSQGIARAIKVMFGLDQVKAPTPAAPVVSEDDEEPAPAPPVPTVPEEPLVSMAIRLRKSGYLTRDSRMKERKKYGRKGARKSFQFSKR